MLDSYNIHTDLALEDKERFESDNVEISGVSVEEVYNEEKEIQITTVKILTENGAKIMRKPVGTYITMETPNLALPDEEYQREVAEELAAYLKEVLALEEKDYTVLVVGLGNREVTPDALGPRVVEELHVTRHIIREYGKYAMDEEHSHMVSAIAPGVMAQTGMETSEIVKGIVSEIKPDFLIVIDALAARNTKRLNRTIQIADTGINPGSGVGNHRMGITEETMGVPVISIGVPTVVDAATIVRDTMESVVETLEGTDQLIAPHLYGMFVTPKDIDETILRLGGLIAQALNLLFCI
ncbi:MAG: GPR endopeptidase [Faecalimonas sp.]|nr:GPR endopeptidase [Faecalimonas sp.]